MFNESIRTQRSAPADQCVRSNLKVFYRWDILVPTTEDSKVTVGHRLPGSAAFLQVIKDLLVSHKMTKQSKPHPVPPPPALRKVLVMQGENRCVQESKKYFGSWFLVQDTRTDTKSSFRRRTPRTSKDISAAVTKKMLHVLVQRPMQSSQKQCRTWLKLSPPTIGSTNYKWLEDFT